MSAVVSYPRYFAVAEETTFKTAAARTKDIDQVDDSLEPDQGIIVSETVGSRFVDDVQVGARAIKGDVLFLVEPENIHSIIKWGLGGITTTSNIGPPIVYNHDIRPVTGITTSVLKSFSAEIGFGTYARLLVGCLVDKLSFESVLREELKCTASLIAASESKLTTLRTPAFSALTPFIFSQGIATIASIDKSAQVKSARVNYNNNLPLDDLYGHGSRDIARIEMQEAMVDGALEYAHIDAAQYDAMLAGTEFAVNLKWTGASTTNPNAGFTNYTLEIDLPRCVYLKDAVPHPSKKERLQSNAPFRALFSSTSSYIAKIVIVNRVTSP